MAKEQKIKINNTTYYFDFELWEAEQAYIKKKEDEYWEWCLSGQRTIDMYGIEGAKHVLTAQEERDRLARESDGTSN